MSPSPLAQSPVKREFLGWDQPPLEEAARRLVERYSKDNELDLGQVIVVLPGRRAGRRLQELVAFRAEDERLVLTPPQVLTEDRLPELLYTPKQPFAIDLVQDLAWAQSLRELAPERRQHVVPHPPAPTDTLRWLELAKVLRRLHVELAADRLDFAAVHASAPKLAGFAEAERWAALVAVQQRYHELLDAQQLWDKQTARLRAIDFNEIRTDCDIILLGTVDLNIMLRQMLDLIAERVTAYIVAPEGLADRFDAHGCLDVGKWRDGEIPLRDEQLRQLDGPEDQADAVSDWLAGLNGQYRVDEVAVGVPDESLVPQLQRQLKQCHVCARWVEGFRLGETAPYRLLAAAVQFVGGRRYDDLAALLRHPDLEEWLATKPELAGKSSLAAQLDEYYNAHLPSRMQSSGVREDAPKWPRLAPALDRIEQWIEKASATLSLPAWGKVFTALLGDVYGKRTLNLERDADADLHETMRRIVGACEQLAALPETLDLAPLPAADAFHLVLGPLATDTLPPPADPDAVEILGWLELPLDDSKAVLVTSFNDGFVPKSTGADAFLPDRLRRELGLDHNERRYARDAYAISVLCASRAELRVQFARRDTKKDPRQPSRLIFACPDDALVARSQKFFGEEKAPPRPRRLLLAPNGPIVEDSLFKVPDAIPRRRRREEVSVTEFKDYLACPYRYYLRHVEELLAVDDSLRELDGSLFGRLLHKVLGDFGRDQAGPRHSDRAPDILDFLAERLAALAAEVFGSKRQRPAVRLQLEQAHRRLEKFAELQAGLVHEGWRIVYVENDQGTLRVPFPVDDEPITLVGRIDRIDFHEANRLGRILDYKTGDTAHKPEQTHRQKGKWIDLQLPLYRHLWLDAQLDLPTNVTVQLGYFNLPKDLDQTRIELAEWDDGDLDSADECARQVIRGLRAEMFKPMTTPAPKFSEDFAAICMDNVYSAPGLTDDDKGGTE
jgi:CRISPR/Cas system-associated exonuclease Cas4 (RecB family)